MTNRHRAADPEAARLADEMHELVGQASGLASEIDATVVALKVFRQAKRSWILIDEEASDGQSS